MGQPAARVSDMHTCPMVTPGTPPIPHVGGPILPPGAVTVLIGGLPAARVGDMALCVGPPDSIVQGSMGVLIGGQPAARMGDLTAHGGTIAAGLPTVLIGDVGGGGSASVASPELKESMAPGLMGLVTEGSGTPAESGTAATAAQLDAIYAKAPAAKAEIDALADQIANQTDGRVAKTPLKSRERAMVKATDDYGGDASKLKDVARNTVVVNQDQYNKAVTILQERGARINRISANSDPLGYSGTNSVVQTNAGIPAEIQVSTPDMIYAKEKPEVARTILGESSYNDMATRTGVPAGRGHELYEQWRSLPKGDPQRDKLAAESRTYYDVVRKRGGR